jgi:hypothetical protein
MTELWASEPERVGQALNGLSQTEYEEQLMLLEQRNKARLMRARQLDTANTAPRPHLEDIRLRNHQDEMRCFEERNKACLLNVKMDGPTGTKTHVHTATSTSNTSDSTAGNSSPYIQIGKYLVGRWAEGAFEPQDDPSLVPCMKPESEDTYSWRCPVLSTSTLTKNLPGFIQSEKCDHEHSSKDEDKDAVREFEEQMNTAFFSRSRC